MIIFRCIALEFSKATFVGIPNCMRALNQCYYVFRVKDCLRVGICFGKKNKKNKKEHI
jgi:hypothetical protein